ncbi:MAG: NAD-glutamate dehydrogenase [Acetobacteraceae bacterium]|nr:NAD-glutamate dehydrogenase [Acetobacteraceae bacterium]
MRAWALEPVPLTVAKANMRSTVHRPQHCDAIILKRIDRSDRVRGADIVLGLFAASAYNRNPRSIPFLREKVAAVLARAGLDPATHDGRRLSNILETYPRDELFQAEVAELHRTAQGILALQERQRVALFLRRDRFERFVSALVFVPRDVMDTRLRIRLGEILARAFAGRLSATYIQIGDSPLARIHYIVATTPGAVPEIDAKGLERVLAEAARSFRDRLAEALMAEAGEGVALARLARWGDAFPAGYAERHGAREAVADIALAEAALARGGLVLALTAAAGSAALRPAASSRPSRPRGAAFRHPAADRVPWPAGDRRSSLSPRARRRAAGGVARVRSRGGGPRADRARAGCPASPRPSRRWRKAARRPTASTASSCARA